LDFVFRQKQYVSDAGNTLSRIRTQPKGNEVFNLIRRKTGEIAGPPIYLETWPVDSGEDAEAAKDAKRVIQQAIHDPLKRYRLRRRSMIAGALTASTWYMKVEWCKSIQPFGDLRFSTSDCSPMHVLPCPGHTDIHDPLCPYVLHWMDVPIDDVLAKGGKGEFDWKETADLWPDNKGKYETREDYAQSTATPSPDRQYGYDTVRVCMKWMRGDPAKKVEPEKYRVLPESERYMSCPCGYKSMDEPRDESGQLPLKGGLCPLCFDGVPQKLSELERIDVERTDGHYLRYPAGRLVIFAPIQRRIFYDGAWPERCRSFPFFQCRFYENPEEYHGQNDASIHWSHQVILNSLRRMGYEQMRTSKRLIIMAGGPGAGKGLVDHRGRPFLLSDENGYIAYTQNPTTQGMIQEFQGQGLPSQFPVYYNIINGALQSTLGSSDLGITQENSKDIAASTVRQLSQMANIPVADHKDVLNEEEGVFLGCVLDILVEHMDVPKAVRYFGPEGQAIVQRLRASDIPNVDVIVTAQPTLRTEQIEDLRVFQQWAALPPPVRKIAARRLGLAPSEIAEFEAEQMKMAQTQPPAVPGMGVPAPNGVPAGMGAPPVPGAVG
jgi:hypothetical protein